MKTDYAKDARTGIARTVLTDWAVGKLLPDEVDVFKKPVSIRVAGGT
jgi:hypothetical protein